MRCFILSTKNNYIPPHWQSLRAFLLPFPPLSFTRELKAGATKCGLFSPLGFCRLPSAALLPRGDAIPLSLIRLAHFLDFSWALIDFLEATVPQLEQAT